MRAILSRASMCYNLQVSSSTHCSLQHGDMEYNIPLQWRQANDIIVKNYFEIPGIIVVVAQAILNMIGNAQYHHYTTMGLMKT